MQSVILVVALVVSCSISEFAYCVDGRLLRVLPVTVIKLHFSIFLYMVMFI